MIVYKNISDLIVDSENPRILKVKNQFKAMNYLISINEDSMFKLINNINDNGYFDQNVVSIVNENKKLIVLDGNRRITAIKCLLNNDLIENYQFKNRVKKIKINKINYEMKIPCKEYKTRKEEDTYIKTQHTEGGSTLKWSSIAQCYFLKENTDIPYEKLPAAFRIYDINFSKEENSKIEAFSTIKRIIGEYEFNQLKELDKNVLKNILLQIVLDTNKDGKQNSRTLNKKENCRIYFENLLKNKLGYEEYEKIKNKNIDLKKGENLEKKYLKNDQSIEKDPYAFVNFEHSNIEQNDEMYKAINKYSKEIKGLSKKFKNYKIAVSLLARSIFEIGLKHWIKRKKLWSELINNNSKSQNSNYDPKISEIIKFIKKKINGGYTLFNKELDEKFKPYFGGEDINMKKKFDILVHSPEKIDIDPDEFMIYTKDFFYNLVYFIFNHKEDNEK